MKWWKYLAAAIFLVGMVWPTGIGQEGDRVGTIKEIKDVAEAVVPTRQALVVVQGREVMTQFYEAETKYITGDRVVIDTSGEVPTIVDYYRTPALRILFGIFLITIILVTDLGGLRSLAGLAVSFLIIFQFILPQIAAGAHPLMVVLTASLGILLISYYLTHGFSTKTTIALIGTFLALVVTGILTMVFGGAAKLTGFGSEEAVFLQSQFGTNISVYNLLLAGIIIGALGVLDDITISQASVVAELKKANNRLGMGELFARGMRVGHDHIASLVNTLVLVYTGTAMPLLLLFVGGEQSWTTLVNYEPVAEEIVRTLVGSIGLIAAVPITTLIAAYWYAGARA